MIRFIPGFVAAVIAYVAVKLVGWATSLSAQAVIFLTTYVVMAVLIDYLMRRYGAHRR